MAMLNISELREKENVETFIQLTGTNEDLAREFLQLSLWDVSKARLLYNESPKLRKTLYVPPKESDKSKKNNYSTVDDIRSKKEVVVSPQKQPKTLTLNQQRENFIENLLSAARRLTEGKYFFGAANQLGFSRSLLSSSLPSLNVLFSETANIVDDDDDDDNRDAVVDHERGAFIPFTINVHLWQNGWTLNEQQILKSYEDKTERSFLSDLSVGVLPLKLRLEIGNISSVNVKFNDKRNIGFSMKYDDSPHLPLSSSVNHPRYDPTLFLLSNNNNIISSVTSPSPPNNDNGSGVGSSGSDSGSGSGGSGGVVEVNYIKLRIRMTTKGGEAITLHLPSHLTISHLISYLLQHYPLLSSPSSLQLISATTNHVLTSPQYITSSLADLQLQNSLLILQSSTPL